MKKLDSFFAKGGDGGSVQQQESRRSLISTGGKLKLRHTDFREPSSRIKGHNFAIRLLHVFESHIDDIRRDFQVLGNKHDKYSVNQTTFTDVLLKRINTKAPLAQEGEEEGGKTRDGSSSRSDSLSWTADLTEEQLKANVVSVFEGIDAVGKGRVNFTELMGYVIDCSLYGQVGHVDERIPELVQNSDALLKNMDVITRAKYCSELGRVLTAGRMIGVIDAATFQTRCFPYAHHAKDRYPATHDVDFVPTLGAFAVVGTNMSVDFVSIESSSGGGRGGGGGGTPPILSIPTYESIQRICFDRSTSNLVVPSREGTMKTYRILEHRTSEAKFSNGVVLSHSHTDSISSLISLERSGLVASGSLDNTVVVHDLETGQPLTRFTGHKSGIQNISYLRHLNFMASSSFDTEPKVWMISSASQKSDAFTLRDMDSPHTGHVVDLCTVPDSPQICTLDVHGLIKLWDVRTFRCSQSLKAEKNLSGIFDVSSLKWHSLIWDEDACDLVVVGQRRIQSFSRRIPTTNSSKGGGEGGGVAKYGSATAALKRATHQQLHAATAAKSESMPVCDEYPIACLAVNPTNQTIATCSERKIRIWDAFTGKQEALFEHMAPESTTISACCVSSKGKSMIVGLRSGKISSHSYSTSAILQTFVEEGPEVLSLEYLTNCGAFAAVTWSGCKVYYDSTSQIEGVRTFYPDPGRQADIKSVFFDPIFESLCAGERTGYVGLWEARRSRFTPDAVRNIGLINAGNVEVNCVRFLTGFSAVAVGSSVGGIKLYTCSPHPAPNRCFGEMLVKNREFTFLEFYPPKKILYCGDDQGTLYAVDVSTALSAVNIRNPSNTWEEMMNTVGRSGVASRTVEALKPFKIVRGHSEAITGLKWLPGTPILISTSSDRRCLVWTLSLILRNGMNPLVDEGTYTVRFVRPAGAEYVKKAVQDDQLQLGVASSFSSPTTTTTATTTTITTTGDTQAADSKGPQGSKGGRGVTATKHTEATEEGNGRRGLVEGSEAAAGVTLLSAAKFDEQMRKLAIELESFVPTGGGGRHSRREKGGQGGGKKKKRLPEGETESAQLPPFNQHLSSPSSSSAAVDDQQQHKYSSSAASGGGAPPLPSLSAQQRLPSMLSPTKSMMMRMSSPPGGEGDEEEDILGNRNAGGAGGRGLGGRVATMMMLANNRLGRGGREGGSSPNASTMLPTGIGRTAESGSGGGGAPPPSSSSSSSQRVIGVEKGTEDEEEGGELMFEDEEELTATEAEFRYRRNQFYEKRHIVDQGGGGEDDDDGGGGSHVRGGDDGGGGGGTASSNHSRRGGGLAFHVTQNFPLPPNAKTERDFLLRQLKDREEEQARKKQTMEDDKTNPYAALSLEIITDEMMGMTSTASAIRTVTKKKKKKSERHQRLELLQRVEGEEETWKKKTSSKKKEKRPLPLPSEILEERKRASGDDERKYHLAPSTTGPGGGGTVSSSTTKSQRAFEKVMSRARSLTPTMARGGVGSGSIIGPTTNTTSNTTDLQAMRCSLGLLASSSPYLASFNRLPRPRSVTEVENVEWGSVLPDQQAHHQQQHPAPTSSLLPLVGEEGKEGGNNRLQFASFGIRSLDSFMLGGSGGSRSSSTAMQQQQQQELERYQHYEQYQHEGGGGGGAMKKNKQWVGERPPPQQQRGFFQNSHRVDLGQPETPLNLNSTLLKLDETPLNSSTFLSMSN